MDNKKAQETMATEAIIFIILNLLFFSILTFFIIRSGSGDSVLEEVYSKKLALILDNMKPGMEVNISAQDLFDRTIRNKIGDFPITVLNNKINVRVSAESSGYDSYYFSQVNPKIFIDVNSKLIIIQT